MQLIPAVASYLGLQSKVKTALTDKHLEMVAAVAAGPVEVHELASEVLADLVEMHVLVAEQGVTRLATAVFLEEDIRQISAIAANLGRALAERLMAVASELGSAPPELRNFLGGIIGAAQGPSQLLKSKGKAVDWKSYAGAYASTKVDFDQACSALETLGPELQVKSVLKGERYTAVFIGPTGRTYLRLVNALYSPEDRAYRGQLLRYLTDSYGMLLSGELVSESLARSAEEVGIFQSGTAKPILVTKDIFARYRTDVQRIVAAAGEIYLGSMDRIFACLRNTASGRQGVPPAGMMMHFGRYCRKALARELYATGFFTDQVPTAGGITIFYENEIAELSAALG